MATKIKTVDQATIDRLNSRAVAILRDRTDRDDDGDDRSAALMAVVAEDGMQLVADYDLDGNPGATGQAVYRLTDGRLINLWLHAATDASIGDGGMGFDDQIGWMDDES